MRRRFSATVFLGVGLGAALVVILGLMARLHDLREDLIEAHRRAAFLHEGSVVPAVALSTLTGDSLMLGEPASEGGRQLLFVFTTTCPHCKATLPAWQGLADSIPKADPRAQVIGVSLDSLHLTAAYVAANHLSYPAVMLEDLRTIALYRALMVPQTVVVSAEGVVRYARTGVLRDGPVLDSVYQAALGESPSHDVAARDVPR